MPLTADDIFRSRLTANLDARRRELKITTTRLADEAGLSRPHCCSILHGMVEPRPTTLERLARALKTTVAELWPADPEDM